MRILGKKFHSKKHKCLGLTFVEMLIATAMVGLVAVALYGMIANGLKIWQIFNQESDQIDSNLLFARIDMDLKNQVGFKGIDFEGSDQKFSLFCRANTPVAENKFSKGLGRVTYYYDPAENSFNRQYIDYEQMFSIEQPIGRAMIDNISNVLISYYFYDEEKQAFLWTDVWPPESFVEKGKRIMPLAVRIAMVFLTEKTISKKIRTLDIPIGAVDLN
jgi:hypothetical protein